MNQKVDQQTLVVVEHHLNREGKAYFDRWLQMVEKN